MKKFFTFIAVTILMVMAQSCSKSAVTDDPRANARLLVDAMVDYVNTGNGDQLNQLLGELCDKYESAPMEEVLTFGSASQQDLMALPAAEVEKISQKYPEMSKLPNFERFQKLSPSAEKGGSATPAEEAAGSDVADYSDVADM